jgi:Protein of unknown function (DUF4065)
MAGGIEFNRGKFNELILLLAQRSQQDPRMSRVKLNKLLYRVDFEAFRRFGRPVTGATYIRGEHGPMAAELPGAETELGGRGYLTWRSEQAGPYTQKVPVVQEPPDETQFSEEELAVINDALEELFEHGGRSAREWSHKESAGWNLVGENEPIPYETAFISTERPDESLFEHAKRLARERSWARVRP